MADMSDDGYQQGLDEMIDTCHSDIHDDDEQIAFVFCPQELGGVETRDWRLNGITANAVRDVRSGHR